MRKFLASVGNAQLLVKKGSTLEHFADVRTLTESTLSFSTTMEDVRAGQGAQLYGRFAHDSGVNVTLTDAMFDVKYIAAQVGSEVLINDKVYGTTTISKDLSSTDITTGITLSDAQDLGVACGLNHKLAWIRKKGCEATDEWDAVTLDDNKIPAEALGSYSAGDSICIQYFTTKPGERVMVSSNFVPSEFVLLLTTKLFAGDASAPETGRPVGEITVKFPRFQLDGQFDLSMAMSSAATVSLNGTALAVNDPSDCEGNGVYAEIIQVIDGESVLTNLTDVLVDYDTGSPVVYGLYNGTSVTQLASKYYKTVGNYIVVADDLNAITTVTAAGWITNAAGKRIGYAEELHAD